jgi:glycosyltransferase involved in cell wall biosynthesis
MPADPKPAPPTPKTVLLNASFAPSLINFRGRFIEAMAAAGHRVHVSAPGIEPALGERLRSIGATPHEVRLSKAGLSPTADLSYFRQLRRLIRDIRADLVVSYTIKPNIWGSLAARSAGAASASMVTGLGYAFIEGGGVKRKLVRSASRLLYRLATRANHAVIFQNPDDEADFIAAGCLADRGKAQRVNGSGVDMEWYAPAPLPAEPVFLMISRFLINKGVREYGAAASAVLARRSDARFLLAGYLDEGPDGIDPSELHAWQASGVEYLGQLEDVRSAIAAASVYVLPSYREGTPRSVLEAMAMGRPVVTTDVPGCRETVIDGENGFLVPPRDAAALARAMERLIGEPALRARMGEKGLALCRAKYDVEQVNAALMRHLSLA